MQIRVGFDIEFDLPAPTPMLLMLSLHPSRAAMLQVSERLHTDPGLAMEEYRDYFGNRCSRILAPAGRLRLWSSTVVPDSGEPDRAYPEARQHPVEALPAETLPFLLASRYCEVDRLVDKAWELFGHTSPGWERVQAICDWVFSHVRFDYLQTHPSKTALDVLNEGTGVCRDFQHLAIAFCRCLNIPARYATGYISDVGEAPNPNAPDFCAWFEAYLGGQWHAFDARNNRPRIGRILMAHGRDAVDVALTTSFGITNIWKFTVFATEVLAEEQIAAPRSL